GWLKLLTLVDRKNINEAHNTNTYTVPRSMESLAELLNMSKSTLYRSIIKPLWNFGLIDLVEWKGQQKLGTKCINVLVYPYPQNNKNLENQPLKQIRNYETDYNSTSRLFALNGGRPKTSTYKNVDLDNRFKNETVGDTRVFRVNVDLINRFKSETPSVSKVKPINITNTHFNIPNKIKVIDSIDSEDSVSAMPFEINNKKTEKANDKEINLDKELIVSLMEEEGKPTRLIKYFASYFNSYDQVNELLITLFRANNQATKMYSAHIAAPIFVGFDDALEQEYINLFLSCIRRVKNKSLEPIDDFNAYFYKSVLECTKNIYAQQLSSSREQDSEPLSEDDFYAFVEQKYLRTKNV
ncbi:MAG: hypothetical protein R3267_06510, partial [Paenisporosarcina sp.]|nr:hypothetical protein [Paenisporosarcina sp.]